jgi:hypothetical protein
MLMRLWARTIYGTSGRRGAPDPGPDYVSSSKSPRVQPM